MSPAPIDSAIDPDALGALRDSAKATGGNSLSQQPAAPPVVDAMIAKLSARLESQPGDIKGSEMLGWSYMNMDQPMQAARAYEAALKLAPTDPEIKKGLDQAPSLISPAR